MDSDDLAQEAFIAAWNKLASYRGESRLETWAFGFARIELVRLFDRDRRRREVPLELGAGEALPSPSCDLRALEALEAFEGQLAHLDRRSARVLRMKLVDDLSFVEAADALGISPSGVKSTYYRGLQELRELAAS